MHDVYLIFFPRVTNIQNTFYLNTDLQAGCDLSTSLIHEVKSRFCEIQVDFFKCLQILMKFMSTEDVLMNSSCTMDLTHLAFNMFLGTMQHHN